MSSLVERTTFRFAPHHAELDQRAKAFADAELMAHGHEESDAFAKAITLKLGAAGLLEPCVELDVRGIALLRERVAYASGLADSMAALQGLGYGPIALMGTPAQKERWRGPVSVRCISTRRICTFSLVSSNPSALRVPRNDARYSTGVVPLPVG